MTSFTEQLSSIMCIYLYHTKKVIQCGIFRQGLIYWTFESMIFTILIINLSFCLFFSLFPVCPSVIIFFFLLCVFLLSWTNTSLSFPALHDLVAPSVFITLDRTQAEMAHTCRGTINLATAHIDTEDACNIVLSSGGRTYHLKASTEVERQRWVTALELAKAKAIRMMNDQSGKSGKILVNIDVCLFFSLCF